MSSAPSQANGQIHSVKGTVVEAIGNATGSDSWKTSGKEEHAKGEAELKAAQAKEYAGGVMDRAQGKMDSVVGAVTGDKTQQTSGNIQDSAGQARMEANKPISKTSDPKQLFLAQTLMSLIDRIPTELLGEIFIFTLRTPTPFLTGVPVVGGEGYTKPYTGHWHRGNWKPRTSIRWVFDAPWTLPHVSQGWRAVSLSLPQLWSTFIVSTAMRERERRLLRVQLGRTADAPLNIIIRIADQGADHPDIRPYNGFLAELVQHCARWRSLRIQYDRYATRLAELQAIDVDMPLLVEFQVTSLHMRYYRLNNRFAFLATRLAPFLKQLLDAAPKLQRLLLTDSNRDISFAPEPRTGLTTYKAVYVDPATHLEFLTRSSTTLVACDLHFPVDAEAIVTFAEAKVVSLPVLRRLTTNNAALLNVLDTPALVDLSVSGTIAPIGVFLARTKCTLGRLTSVHPSDSLYEIVSILRQTTALSTLRVALERNTSHQADILQDALADAELVPKLRTLEWTDRTDLTNRNALAQLVESRRRTTSESCFRELRVCMGRLRMGGYKRRIEAVGVDVEGFTGKRTAKRVASWTAI
uniref:CsbD-like domain-containing protein n=1 Tax=Mycena chlorophos TaxID=658473 RepID=A0ABQ0L0S8_MYCCL|nr:predicted protein [Mycena chlorophos]